MALTKMKVPLLDLNRQYDGLKADVMSAIERVFDSKAFIMGKDIKELESVIAEYSNCKDAVGVSSGTDALLISLMALDIGPGDEVITTPFTFFATAGSIARVGATPVFVDINPETYNMDTDLIESKITDKTKAIMPVHLFGQMADMDKIMDLADKYNLKVIEDAAQAIGSRTLYRGKECPAGSIGDVGCFSFFPSKNLGCCGDGGIVTTNNTELAEKLRVMRVHGSKPKYYHHVIGGNFRLDPIQAAILLVKFPFLQEQHEKRRQNAAVYDSLLKDSVKKPFVKDGNYMIYNQYTIRISNRDDLMTELNNYEIGNAVYYPVPLHLQQCFSHLGYKEGDCPESEAAANEVVSIPVFPELSKQEIEYVSEVINSFV